MISFNKESVEDTKMSDSNFTMSMSVSKPMNIRVSPTYVEKPSYMMVGKGGKVRRGIQGYDLLGAMLNFNSGMSQTFKLIVDGLDVRTNCCDLSTLTFNKTQQNMISAAYKQLSGIDLVKRIRKGVYMINPRAIIPPQTYPEAQAVWDSKINKNLIVTSSSEELSHE